MPSKRHRNPKAPCACCHERKRKPGYSYCEQCRYEKGRLYREGLKSDGTSWALYQRNPKPRAAKRDVFPRERRRCICGALLAEDVLRCSYCESVRERVAAR
jgi:hypothetical protein